MLVSHPHPRRTRRSVTAITLVAALVAGILAATPPAVAATSTISIVVKELGTATTVGDFEWLINEDNAKLAGSGDIPSLTGTESYSPVVATGDASTASGISLQDGRYLISIDAPGYKLWGTHVTLPADAGAVTIEVTPEPLPLATLQVHVFHDNALVNGANDGPITGPDGDFEEGLAGFELILEDGTGEVTVDYYGNPLCGGRCMSDANGDIVVPNLPPNKYEVMVSPPDDPDTPYVDWIQTTTIEGTHVIDAWLEEGSEGFAAEEGFRTAPAASFGFIQRKSFPGTGGYTITGHAANAVEWVPPLNPGVTSDDIRRPWIALNDVGNTDRQVYTGRGNKDGTFTIPNVPAGIYELVIWDDPLDSIITFTNVQVTNTNVDVGTIPVPRWFGWQSGSVFQDDDRDGLKDGNEVGLPGVDLDIRFRDGSIAYATFTNKNGKYRFDEIFPFGKFLVSEVGFGRFGATGATGWTPDDANQDPLVDPPSYTGGEGTLTLSTLTFFGRRNVIDWGKIPYDFDDPTDNGGISGIVFHDTTRAELDPRFNGPEDYQPGVPDVTVELWDLGANEEWDGGAGDDAQINEATTDHWSQPADCSYLDQNGNPLPDDVPVEPACVESILLGNEIKDGVFDGGYAFFDACPAGTFPCGEADLQPLSSGRDYVVRVVEPTGYKIVTEEDVNTAEGDEFPAPAVPPAKCVGAQFVVDDPNDGPFDGQTRRLCNERFVTLDAGQNAAADFFLMVDNGMQPPGRYFGVVLDDLNVEPDPAKVNYGEKAGIAGVPVGIRDYTGRLLTTVVTDDNGMFDVLVPSTRTINCPTPGGVCPGMYELRTNDPGDPGAPNQGFNPAYPTLSVVLQAMPGKTTIADLALLPSATRAACELPTGTPEIRSVDRVTMDPVTLANLGALPAAIDDSTTSFQVNEGVSLPAALRPGNFDILVDQEVMHVVTRSPGTAATGLHTYTVTRGSSGSLATSHASGALVRRVTGGAATRAVTIDGVGFGNAPGTLTLTPDNGANPVTVPTTTWSDTQITVFVPTTIGAGPRQVLVRTAAGVTSQTGITIHVRNNATTPPVRIVNPATETIQQVIDAAPNGAIVVVPPGRYYENVIVHKGIRLQGMGPGEPIAGDGGSIIDGSQYAGNATGWAATLDAITFDGNQEVLPGAAVTVVGRTSGWPAQPRVDGFRIMRQVVADGGAVHLNAFTQNARISNNVIEGNSGLFGGGVIVGQPYVGDNQNDGVWIRYNRILHNGGLRLAGGVGLFNGAQAYRVTNNEVCGNYAAEYGGGISHHGNMNFSSNAASIISDNRIVANEAFDEGGGVIVGGETLPGQLGSVSGPVRIEANLIQSNLSNDDGGGVRLLAPLTSAITIQSNFIVNNVATDIGGGIALDDASNVNIRSNTIAYNDTTSTAVDADGNPHGAGIASAPHSSLFDATVGGPNFSRPTLLGNILWNNTAYGWNGTALTGPTVIDLEVVGAPVTSRFAPTYSILTTNTTDWVTASATNNIGTDPLFVDGFANDLETTVFYVEPDFVDVNLLTNILTPFGGDYHLTGGSPAIDDAGTAGVAFDIDRQARPQGPAWDMGGDEVAP